jgi:hypothetical protein
VQKAQEKGVKAELRGPLWVRFPGLFLEDIKDSGGFYEAVRRKSNVTALGILVETEIVGAGD